MFEEKMMSSTENELKMYDRMITYGICKKCEMTSNLEKNGVNLIIKSVFCRFWFIHGHPTWIQMTGAEIKS
jgi:hypothetical protein